MPQTGWHKLMVRFEENIVTDRRTVCFVLSIGPKACVCMEPPCTEPNARWCGVRDRPNGQWRGAMWNLFHRDRNRDQNRRHSVQFHLLFATSTIFHANAHDQAILVRRTREDRTACKFKISSPLRLCSFFISFRDIPWNRLAGPKPLGPRLSMGAFQFFGILKDPYHIANGQALNVSP